MAVLVIFIGCSGNQSHSYSFSFSHSSNTLSNLYSLILHAVCSCGNESTRLILEPWCTGLDVWNQPPNFIYSKWPRPQAMKVPFHHPLMCFFKCSKIHQNIQKIYSSIQISSKYHQKTGFHFNSSNLVQLCFSHIFPSHRLHWNWNCPRCPITDRWSAHLKQE